MASPREVEREAGREKSRGGEEPSRRASSPNEGLGLYPWEVESSGRVVSRGRARSGPHGVGLL